MKRGRDISHLHISVDVFGKVKLKKYTWICEICGREYISREHAKDCESYHMLIEKGYEEDADRLYDYLTERFLETQALLMEEAKEVKLTKLEKRILSEIVRMWTPEKDEVYPDICGLSWRCLESTKRLSPIRLHKIFNKFEQLGLIRYTVRKTVFRPTEKARQIIMELGVKIYKVTCVRGRGWGVRKPTTFYIKEDKNGIEVYDNPELKGEPRVFLNADIEVFMNYLIFHHFTVYKKPKPKRARVCG